MIEKQVPSLAEAINGIHSGATILVGGFGDAGTPVALLEALLEDDISELTIVANNAGSGNGGLESLLREGRVRKVICSFPRSKGSVWFARRYLANEVELEIVPQGTLTERIRAAGAGIGGFFTSTGVGTELASGRETRIIDGREHLFETPLFGDVALIKAHRADRRGNLTYHASGRNYGPTMAAAAQLTVVQVDEIVPLGSIDPENVITPGILIDRVVKVESGKT